ncbi:hypothetical protein QBC38DRAFT_359630 [Podospora fimiseda]|uniref:Uncharacterized protein n=1 Tax=Podospora fimiseda TaxID=252190 RepID=A0AAN7BTU4_9PEZI|nr:hypothetical protein QBC38DRAFT_359630 [Podospora fimiseda]
MLSSPTWHSIARIFQLLGSLSSAGFHGFLTLWVYKKKLGLSQLMLILQLLITIIFLYTVFAIIFQSKKQRASNKKSNWLVLLVVLDVFFCGVLLGIITLLAHAGLPLHCAGLTREDFVEGDEGIPPQPGYSTVRFSKQNGKELPGGLDNFCGLERSYFFVSNAMVFSYIITIVISMVRVVEQRLLKHYPHKFDAGDEEVNLKDLSVTTGVPTSSSSASSPSSTAPGLTAQLSQQNLQQHSPPAPHSEGIITRSNSLRSTVTTATTSTHSGGRLSSSTPGPYRSNTIPRRPVGSGSASGSRPSASFTPIPLQDEEDAAMVVSDGMRHQPQQQQQQVGVGHHRQGSASQSQYQQLPRMPMLLEEDQISVATTERTDGGMDAHHALVSDGMRPSAPMLPPYEPPGSGRLQGYGKRDH